jgi:hypothetical protein
MTVQELIDKLQLMDPAAEVYVNGYEGGYCDITQATPIQVCRNFNNAWYYGPHESYDRVENPLDYEIATGILLGNQKSL